MKIEILDKEKEEVIEVKRRLKVYDGKGNQYTLMLNKFGELELNAVDGGLSIEPYMSNEVIIKTRN